MAKVIKEIDEFSLIHNVSDLESQAELEKISYKYHIRAAWIGAIFDPLFAITDFFNLPASWKHVFVIRCSIAVIALFTLWISKKKNFPSFITAFVPVFLISLQNAYTFYLIGNEDITGHVLNYIALLIGASMFVLWRWAYSVFAIVFSAIVTAFFVSQNPNIHKQTFIIEGGFLLAIVGIFMIILIQIRYDLILKEIKARLALKKSNSDLEEQKELVEKRNENITSSIKYAKRIQDAVLGRTDILTEWFSESLVFFKPKDILSGDFYWLHEDKQAQTKIVIAADCTGHGVPAALMTVLGHSLLDEIIIQNKIYKPDIILKELDLKIIESLKNKSLNQEDSINDGMDVSILVFEQEKVFFAAAKNPLYIVSSNFNAVVKGSRFPIGSSQYNEKTFECHELDVKKGDKLYIYSDGFQDQFGGEKNQKFLSANFRELIAKTAIETMQTQEEILNDVFSNWKGEVKQTDDVLVVGICV